MASEMEIVSASLERGGWLCINCQPKQVLLIASHSFTVLSAHLVKMHSVGLLWSYKHNYDSKCCQIFLKPTCSKILAL